MLELSGNTYQEKLERDELSVVLFKIEGCSPCVAVERKLVLLEEKYEKWNFYKINLSSFPELSGTFQIFTSPTIVLFNKGKELTRFSRNFSIDFITEYMNRVENAMR
jgi:thioredoxin 1